MRNKNIIIHNQNLQKMVKTLKNHIKKKKNPNHEH